MRRFVITLFCVCILSFIGIALNVVLAGNDGFDRDVISFISGWRTDWMVEMMKRITFFGSGNFLVPAYVVLIIILVYLKRRYEALSVLILSVSSLLILSELKLLFHRHRPDLPLIANIATFSFPSGHSFSSVVFFGLLAFLVKEQFRYWTYRRITVAFLLFFSFLIGFSRIVLNVHFATDVLAGFSLGFVWLVLCYLVFHKTRLGNAPKISS